MLSSRPLGLLPISGGLRMFSNHRWRPNKRPEGEERVLHGQCNTLGGIHIDVNVHSHEPQLVLVPSNQVGVR